RARPARARRSTPARRVRWRGGLRRIPIFPDSARRAARYPDHLRRRGSGSLGHSTEVPEVPEVPGVPGVPAVRGVRGSIIGAMGVFIGVLLAVLAGPPIQLTFTTSANVTDV